MLLLQSLTPVTRTLQSVTVAGMFAIVPMVLLPRMRSETYVLHDPTQVPQTLWTLHALESLYMLFQSVLAMYSSLNMMKLVVASQIIFLGSPGVYMGITKTEL